MPKSPDQEGSPRLMTTTEIAAEHGVTRQTVHTHRKNGVFPKPVEGEGSTRPRFRADEVAAFFAANPPSPGKRTDLASQQQQGEPVNTATARDRLVETLESPGLVGYRTEEAAELLDAYRAAVLREAADIAEALRQFEPATGARKSAQVSENVGILRVADELRRVAAEAEASDG